MFFTLSAMKQSGKRSRLKAEPVLQKFQPKNFKVVTGKKLEEWEASVLRKIGIPRSPGPAPVGVLCATISQCHGPYSPDDSDYIRHIRMARE